MKIEKNKIVFVAVILCVVLFIASYSVIVLGEEEEPTIENNQISIPELKDEQRIYGSKLEAIEDIKEERQFTAPSLYPEHMVDEKGYFNPDYMEYEKHRIIDSIYQNGTIRYAERQYDNIDALQGQSVRQQTDTIAELKEKEPFISTKELALEHLLFFASHPSGNDAQKAETADNEIYVRVDGTQTVKKDYRLQLRLSKAATIDGRNYPRNTLLFGFISFKPNRTVIAIESIDHQSVKLKAFDLQDGGEGVYIENSFRAKATQELIDNVADDINIAGVPQVTGIKRLFQRSNRSVKVTIIDNYQLILKPNP